MTLTSSKQTPLHNESSLANLSTKTPLEITFTCFWPSLLWSKVFDSDDDVAMACKTGIGSCTAFCTDSEWLRLLLMSIISPRSLLHSDSDEEEEEYISWLMRRPFNLAFSSFFFLFSSFCSAFSFSNCCSKSWDASCGQ
ncbi:U5 small nuclear ribonucleoprotein 200 kDa helicase [Striga asiatica]|uniref:U5 small nuclear ribonucleoprotein 200 kDa helicase n=1 Tax=Striga asiatica TaxID=4170 RepID=A0A5A7P0H7_STRAF|nr:U5 small nuclear ribonucleoprotein 200 kDa helicase [Striga asiatica]